jgi:Zn-dependent protease with chaperone function
MDFFDREAHAQKLTRRLLLLFGFAVVAVVALTYLVFALLVLPGFKHLPHLATSFNPFINLLMSISEALMFPARFLRWLWDPWFFSCIALATLLSIFLGCLYKFRLLAGGGGAVAEMLGGRKIESDLADLNEKKLRDVVEEMAVASGMPAPEIYVLDRERGINSFAAGHTRDDVAIGVTVGAIKLLTRDELQGIVAHEFSHVLNGDTRLNMKLMALAHGLFWPTIVGRVFVHGSPQAPEIGASIFDEDTPPVFLPTAPIGVLFLAVGGISSPFVRLIKSLICREREWLADAAAVQFTRNPAGISGALKKIGGLCKAGRLDTPRAESASQLYFADSTYDPWFEFMATHPPLAKRILAIDPAFDGQFAHVNSLPRQVEENPQEIQYEKTYQESLRRAREQAQEREETE